MQQEASQKQDYAPMQPPLLDKKEPRMTIAGVFYKEHQIVMLCFLFMACQAVSEPANTFTHPAPIGTSVTRYDEPDRRYEIALTVLKVSRGKDAEQLAKTTLDADTFSPPPAGTEYLAVNVAFDVKRGPNSDSIPLYPNWHVTLRDRDAGEDNVCLNWRKRVTLADAPYHAETWLFFVVREGSQPLLYFQPYRMFSSQEYRNSGAYLGLSSP